MNDLPSFLSNSRFILLWLAWIMWDCTFTIYLSVWRVPTAPAYWVKSMLMDPPSIVSCISLSGRPIDGVWHTGVGVYGREYLFGSSGVSYTAPEEIHRQGLAPKPKGYVRRTLSLTYFWIDPEPALTFSHSRLDLGQTKKTLPEIQSWIAEKGSSSFR